MAPKSSPLGVKKDKDTKVTAETSASGRPKRAAAAKKVYVDELPSDEGSEDDFPEIDANALAKWKKQVNASPQTIQVIRKDDIDPKMLKALKVDEWPEWESTTGGWPELDHPYEYDHPLRELSLFLEGSALVTPDGAKQGVEIHAGDYAVFPKKLACTWTIISPVKKKYFEFSK